MSSNIKINRICTYCKCEFEAKTTITRYCSHECNRKHYKEVKRQEKIQSVNKLIVPIRGEVKIDCQQFSIPDSARVLGVSERTIFRLIEKKIIKPTKKRNKVMISKNELLKYKVYENLA